MTKNPYDSAEHSLATMRDVKNFVCVSLDMHGLCDDDFGMELLVAGKIVSLDLSVAEVFEHVWRRAVESGAAGANGDDGGDNRVGGADPRRRIRGRHRLADDDDDDDDDYDYYYAGNRDPPPPLVLRRRSRPWWSPTGCRASTGRRRRRWYPRLTARAPRLTRTRR